LGAVANEPWQVRIALDSAEVEAIVAAMLAAAPRDRWGMSEPEDDAFPVLSIEIQTESRERAYGQVRMDSQLSLREPGVLARPLLPSRP
jgi:hypothetical protein